MKFWVVTKSPVDLPDTFEFVGVFSSLAKASAACTGAGTYKIAEMEVDRAYSGDLLDVSIKRKLDHRQL